MPISPQALTRPAAAAEEVIDVAEQEALVGSARQGGGDLPFHRWGEDLIGIEKQHPFGAGGVMPQEPVALLGEVAVPVKADHVGTVGGRHGSGGIGAHRIDHHHPLGEISADGLQTDGQVALFVAHWDGNGEIKRSVIHLVKACIGQSEY